MHALVTTDTPFHIDLNWWRSNDRNLGRFLAEILGEQDAEAAGEEPLDYVDPHTAEVHRLDPLWATVLIKRAHQPDYITSGTPLTNALLRALVENVNRPMSAVALHRRINRSNPDTLLRVLKTARVRYGIVPLTNAKN